MERRGRRWLDSFWGSQDVPQVPNVLPQHVLNNSSLYPITFALNIILCNAYITHPEEGITIHIIYIYIYTNIFLKMLNFFFVMVTSLIFFCYEWANQRLPMTKL